MFGVYDAVAAEFGEVSGVLGEWLASRIRNECVTLMLSRRFCKSSDETKKQKVIQILEKLISLTIQEVEMYPSIQAKIWGSIGKVSELIDTVLECFLKRCAEVRVGSPVVEILADTAVALASANVQLVARKIISRLCSVSEEEWIYCFALCSGIFDM